MSTPTLPRRRRTSTENQMSKAKQALFGLLFVMSNGADNADDDDRGFLNQRITTYVLVAFDALQLLVFPISQRAQFPWPTENGVGQLISGLQTFDIANYMHISWFMTAMYTLIFTMVTFILCLSLYVCYVITTQRNFHSIYTLRVLLKSYTVAPQLLTALFIPLLKVFVDLTVHCPYASSCTSGGPLIIQAFVVFEALFFLSFAFLVASTFFDSRPINGGLRARAHTRADTVYLCFRGVLVLAFGIFGDVERKTNVFNTGHQMIEQQVILVAVMVVGGAYSLYAFMYYLPYYNLAFSRARMCILATFVWASFCCGLTLLYQNPSDGAPVWTFIFCYPLVIMLVYQGAGYRQRMLLEYPVDECAEAFEVELKVRLYMQAALTKYRQRRGGFVAAEAAVDREFQDAVSHGLMVYEFASSLPRFSSDVQLHLFYYHFVLTFCPEAPDMAAELLAKCEQLGPRIDEEYIIYHAKTMVMEKELKRAAKTGGGGGSGTDANTSELTGNYYFDMVRATLANALRAEETFWAELENNTPDPSVLRTQAIAYNRHLGKLAADIRGLSVLLDNNFASIDARELCGRVMVDRTLNVERGRQILDNLDTYRHQRRRSSGGGTRRRLQNLSLCVSPTSASTGAAAVGSSNGVWLSRSGTPRNSPRARASHDSAVSTSGDAPMSPSVRRRYRSIVHQQQPPPLPLPPPPAAPVAAAVTTGDEDDSGGDDHFYTLDSSVTGELLKREAKRAITALEETTDDGFITDASPAAISSATTVMSPTGLCNDTPCDTPSSLWLLKRKGDSDVILNLPELTNTSPLDVIVSRRLRLHDRSTTDDDDGAGIGTGRLQSRHHRQQEQEQQQEEKQESAVRRNTTTNDDDDSVAALEERMKREMNELVQKHEQGIDAQVQSLKKTTWICVSLLIVLAVALFCVQLWYASAFINEQEDMMIAHVYSTNMIMAAVHVRALDLHHRNLSSYPLSSFSNNEVLRVTSLLSQLAPPASMATKLVHVIEPQSFEISTLASAVKAFLFHAEQLPVVQRSIEYVVRNTDTRQPEGIVQTLDTSSRESIARLYTIIISEYRITIVMSLMMVLVCLVWLMVAVPRSVRAIIGDMYRVTDVYFSLPKRVVSYLHNRADEKLSALRHRGRVLLDEEMNNHHHGRRGRHRCRSSTIAYHHHHLSIASAHDGNNGGDDGSGRLVVANDDEERDGNHHLRERRLEHNRRQHAKVERRFVLRFSVTFIVPLLLVLLSLVWPNIDTSNSHNPGTVRHVELRRAGELQCAVANAMYHVREYVVEHANGCQSLSSHRKAYGYSVLNITTKQASAAIDLVDYIHYQLMFSGGGGGGDASQLSSWYVGDDVCGVVNEISRDECVVRWPGGVLNAVRTYVDSLRSLVEWESQHSDCSDGNSDIAITKSLNSSSFITSSDALHHVLSPSLQKMTEIFNQGVSAPYKHVVFVRMCILIGLVCTMIGLMVGCFMPTLNRIVTNAKRSQATLSIIPIHVIAAFRVADNDDDDHRNQP